MSRKPPRLGRFAPLTLLAFALLGLSSPGCGGAGSKTVPFVGQLFVQGQPAVGAAVTFYPLSSTKPRQIPTAVVGPDGSFRLTTVSAYDGAHRAVCRLRHLVRQPTRRRRDPERP